VAENVLAVLDSKEPRRYSSWEDLEADMRIYREAGGTNADHSGRDHVP
jgi:hypothetical protein